MKRWSNNSGRLRLAGLVLALAGLSLGVATAATAVGTAIGPAAAAAQRPTAPAATWQATCSAPGPGRFRCLSYWHPLSQPQAVARTTSSASAAVVAAPKKGLTPANIRAAYQLPKTGGKGQTIALVDAFDNPHLESDLKAYRAAFKLPACTTANKCFRKVDQRGTKKYPTGDADWGIETSLDVDAVSAACSGCKILVVEADDNGLDSLGAAENTAVKLGATVVSNSYGADEFNGIIALGKKYYTHPGVPIVASSGDFGFIAASFPAVLKTTWAVGGTELSVAKKGTWSEAAWEFAGSGCSAWIAKPAAQKDTRCAMRTVSDLSAVADSADGYAVYDTYGLSSSNGWVVESGTSLSSPLIAAMIGLAGNATKASTPAYAYAHRSGLKDVVGGSNGFCGNDYLCTGVKGYDAPTGLGSPRGLKAL